MKRSAQKMLDALKEAGHPLRWYEIGILAYPLSVKRRTNILGQPFDDLVGSGLSAAHQGIGELEEAGLVTMDDTFRYTVRAKP